MRKSFRLLLKCTLLKKGVLNGSEGVLNIVFTFWRSIMTEKDAEKYHLWTLLLLSVENNIINQNESYRTSIVSSNTWAMLWPRLVSAQEESTDAWFACSLRAYQTSRDFYAFWVFPVRAGILSLTNSDHVQISPYNTSTYSIREVMRFKDMITLDHCYKESIRGREKLFVF